MSVIGGQNPIVQDGLVYILDFGNQRSYISGSNTAQSLVYSPVTASFTGSTPNLVNDLLEFTDNATLLTNQSFPGFSYNEGNLTVIFAGQTKDASTLLTQDGTVAVVSTTSSIGYGSHQGNLGRNFPATGFNHVALRFTTGSVDCFVNGIPTGPSSIFPSAPSSSVNTDFKIAGNFISSFTGSYSGSLGNLLVYNRQLSDDEIYAIYSQQARRYGLLEQDKPYTTDSSVYAYTQAAGITGSSVITALDAFVVGLKANNLWNKMIAIYPFLGSDTTKTRYNLKDPSLNTTQINYSGSWSASLSGSYNNNTSSYGILRNIKGDYFHPLINSQSIHLSYLSYDTPVSSGYLMGTEELLDSPILPGDIAQPAAAYSVRKIRTAYTGSCMDIRRDLDNTTGSIGFDAFGNLDTGSLLAFVTGSEGTGSGFVARWYDQSGNNNHANQTSSAMQPTIVISGSIYTQNNKPSPYFDGTDDYLITNVGSFTPSTPLTFVGISTPTGSLPFLASVIFTNGSSGISIQSGGSWFLDGSGAGTSNSATLPVNQSNPGIPQLLFGVYTSTTTTQNTYLYKNVNEFSFYSGGGAPRSTGNVIFIGARDPSLGRFLRGYIQETFLYTQNLLSSRGIITQNINNYFNIYTTPGYNTSANSLSLFSNPIGLAGAANNETSNIITGGPLGLVTVSRTGSSDYTLWKRRVPNKVISSPTIPLNTELYLNAANASNVLFSGSRNNVLYASVGAGLTDDEVYTYYELVDNLQTGLGREVINSNAFITTWDTRISGTGAISNTNQIVLPLVSTQAITASWGDGTVSLISSSGQIDRTHSYATPGVYTISITGTGQGFQFAAGGDFNKIINIGQWGSIPIATTRIFHLCTNLTATTPKPPIITSPNIELLFLGSKFNDYVNDWDTSIVTSMQQVFNASLFNQSINNWNVSNVTNMQQMFQSATRFNQNIGAWNVEKVTNMSTMLATTPFNNGGSPSINNWRPISCSNFSSMFSSATAFNQPIGNWPISASSVNMSGMFGSAAAFNQNIGAWNVEKVTNMSGMFAFATNFNNSGSNSINNWRPISCSAFNTMFYGPTNFNQPIGNWPLSASNINMEGMFIFAQAFNQDIGSWDISRATDIRNMFRGATAFNNSGSDSINNWNISNITSTFRMFSNATAFNRNIGSWSVSNITNFNEMFVSATNFNNGNSPDISNWVIRTASAVTMNNMFESTKAFNQPIGSWDVSKVTSMASMLRDADAFNQDIGTWNLSSCTSLVNFMLDIPAANYSYLHTIYDGWINNKLNPNLQLVNFGGIKYSGSAAQGRGLLSRTYNTASIIGSNDNAGQLAITCSVNHNVTTGNKIFISGSTFGGINGVQIVQSTGSATTLTLAGVPYNPAANNGEIITGYGWQLIDGGVVV